METVSMIFKELPYEIEEEIKTLRTNILFSGAEKKVILITSCVSGEGKSSVSINLAHAMQQLGKKVLLIDSDLRKSKISYLLNKAAKTGLSHYLSGQCDAIDALYQIKDTNLHIMPAGKNPPNPSELLGSERMKAMINAARQAYDYVIVDSAPLGLVTDAAVVAAMCDASILLLESGKIAYPFAKDVLEKLRASQCPVLGAIVNKVDPKTVPHRYGRYGKYEKYDRYSRYEKYYSKDGE